MKYLTKLSLFIFTVLSLSLSCSHQQSHERLPANRSCFDSIKPEYQSYFESVEKCMEKETDK